MPQPLNILSLLQVKQRSQKSLTIEIDPRFYSVKISYYTLTYLNNLLLDYWISPGIIIKQLICIHPGQIFNAITRV